MSFANYIPGLAHIKAGLELICNDKEAAARTMETFHTKTPIVSHLTAGIAKLAGNDEIAKQCWDGGNSSLNALPVVGHVKGIGHYVCGDIEGGNQAMADATSTTSNIADGIPVVGHVKGVIHYACGDTDGGNKAMKASTRTTAVMAAGAGGFVFLGPAGAVAGGVAVGGGWDVTTAAVTDGKEANGIAKIFKDPTSVESYFDAGFSVVGDGLAGYSGGKIAEKALGPKIKTDSGSTASLGGGEAEAAAAQKLVDDLEAGRISYTEYQQKWNAIKPNDVPVKVNAEQLRDYSNRGLITERQYNQAMTEMSKNGSKQTTVFISSSTDRLGNKSKTSDEEMKNKQKSNNNRQDDQPPQQPTNSKAEAARVLNLRRQLTQLLNNIQQRIENDRMQLDTQFRREAFQQLYSLVSELFSNGHYAYIMSGDLNLVISSDDGAWYQTIYYDVADYLSVHDQLINQQFSLTPGSTCPTVLSAQFQESYLVLSVNHSGGACIYGIRCRICDRRDGSGNINYVGLTKRSVHNRVCGEHARAVEHLITNRANEDAPRRPMYEHAADHFNNGDPRVAFRQVMDVILLPNNASSPAELRSWEKFWQFILHCRKFFWGWSER